MVKGRSIPSPDPRANRSSRRAARARLPEPRRAAGARSDASRHGGLRVRRRAGFRVLPGQQHRLAALCPRGRRLDRDRGHRQRGRWSASRSSWAARPRRAAPWCRAPATAFGCAARSLKKLFESSGDVQHLLLRFTQALITQMTQTAVCNRHHAVDQQLCRWLLLMLDRLASNEVLMTQELIANMLGVRREGVTEAAGKLQAEGLIEYRRGHITRSRPARSSKRACASATRWSRTSTSGCSRTPRLNRTTAPREPRFRRSAHSCRRRAIRLRSFDRSPRCSACPEPVRGENPVAIPA